MPSPGGQFFSDEFGDIEDYFVSDYQLIDQYIGDQLWNWGFNSSGQLGVNDTIYRSTPVTTILGGTNWKQVSFNSAIKTDGTLWLWGNNSYGQLGVNNTASRSIPVTTILGGTNWKSVFSRGSQTITAIKTDGTLWVWGRNEFGQLGVNDTITRSTPVTTILGETNWKSVSCRDGNTAAIKTDGTLWTWGGNASGQLGINDRTERSTPVTTILGGTNWKSVVCGSFCIAAIKTDGTLWVWGSNSLGELGLNNRAFRSIPVTTILGGTNWKSVDIADSATVAIKTDGTLWVWGRNEFGQLGVNDTIIRSTPVTTILGGTNWKSAISEGFNTAAIKTDGTLWTWGYNDNGQLGVNDLTNRNTPVTTILGGNNWKSLSGNSVVITAITAGVEIGFTTPTEVIFDVPGTYTWYAPVGVTTVSVVCVGGGGGSTTSGSGGSGSGGGGLGYKNNISVSTGIGYTVVVGSGGTKVTTGFAGTGGNSYFISLGTVAGYGGGGGQAAGDTVGVGGTYFGDGGGNGGSGGTRGGSAADAAGGGGAGGYSGAGGAGGAVVAGVGGNGSAGAGGGAGGGGGCGTGDTGGCGGGVGLYGSGTSGNGGAGSANDGAGGFGGSGGQNAAQASATAPGNVYSTTVPSTPGEYGGGGCGSDVNNIGEVSDGASGAVRIIWSYTGSTPTFS
jgi:alpha-tubulin suppressor-like RCC1 family protein